VRARGKYIFVETPLLGRLGEGVLVDVGVGGDMVAVTCKG
jgi:hypothetical protein